MEIKPSSKEQKLNMMLLVILTKYIPTGWVLNGIVAFAVFMVLHCRLIDSGRRIIKYKQAGQFILYVAIFRCRVQRIFFPHSQVRDAYL